MSGKGLNALFCRHRCPSFHSCDDHTLGNIRKCILQVQCRCSSAEGTDTRAGIIGDSLFIQDIHLLTDRTIDTWIAGVETNGHLTFSLCSLHNRDHFLKGHLCTVMDGAHILGILQKLGIYKRSRIDDHICLLQILFTSDCDKIR